MGDIALTRRLFSSLYSHNQVITGVLTRLRRLLAPLDPAGSCDFLRHLRPGCYPLREEEGTVRSASRLRFRAGGGTDPWRRLPGEERMPSGSGRPPIPIPPSLVPWLTASSRRLPRQSAQTSPLLWHRTAVGTAAMGRRGLVEYLSLAEEVSWNIPSRFG